MASLRCVAVTGCGNGLPGFAYRDIGIVVLSEPVPTSVVDECAVLPTAGLVDSLVRDTSVDLVGYGVSQRLPGGGPPLWTGPRVRLFAPTQPVSLNFVHAAEFIRLSANPAQDKAARASAIPAGRICSPGRILCSP